MAWEITTSFEPLTLYRVQDLEGRGPYRPGFSDTWTDPDNDGANCPNEFTPKQIAELAALAKSKFSARIAFAFRSLEQLHRWFRPAELRRLQLCGYSIVSIDADAILAETNNQVLFMRRAPLRRGVIILPHSLQEIP